jgi:hypothetical protein
MVVGASKGVSESGRLTGRKNCRMVVVWAGTVFAALGNRAGIGDSVQAWVDGSREGACVSGGSSCREVRPKRASVSDGVDVAKANTVQNDGLVRCYPVSHGGRCRAS